MSEVDKLVNIVTYWNKSTGDWSQRFTDPDTGELLHEIKWKKDEQEVPFVFYEPDPELQSYSQIEYISRISFYEKIKEIESNHSPSATSSRASPTTSDTTP